MGFKQFQKHRGIRHSSALTNEGPGIFQLDSERLSDHKSSRKIEASNKGLARYPPMPDQYNKIDLLNVGHKVVKDEKTFKHPKNPFNPSNKLPLTIPMNQNKSG
jgi:hypothetical protein